ncbi:hypothetical protein E2562_013380 [Oryza meyeriana var. granulata]|uniref:Uncharacterized protein n=1 Tax=Oryza meyeriana var. granulata TaxID=110450 RepID=A0A6G1CGH9_9ORYZ|nr:hypothetical protein E2562_013380 [Oryza meyeriana var. granulata]
MASPPCHLPHALLTLLALVPILASAGLVLEDGYTVATAADLNHVPASPHPYALLPRPRAGDLVLLDSAGSALYTLALPLAAVPRSLAGGGRAGFNDGEPRDSAFDHPRSFAVDDADNVYVADRIHGAVRKIAPSGFTTTIAGGRSKGPGHKDGDAQNATFSQDFELVYVPKMCALLVTDRGNSLIRQINLKREDCARETQLGTVSGGIICLLIFSLHVLEQLRCRLLQFYVHFLVQLLGSSFSIFTLLMQEVSINRFFRRMQMLMQYERIQRRATLISFSDIKSVVANPMFHALLLKIIRVSLGYLSVVFPSVSIGLDNKADASTELVGNFIGFDADTSSEEDNEPASDVCASTGDVKEPAGVLAALLDSPQVSSMKIDDMIEANLSDFSVSFELYFGMATEWTKNGC